MKKVFLALLFLGFHVSVLPISSYNQLRRDFKNRSYTAQEGLMRKSPFMLFFESFFQDAEETLAVLQYCKKNPNTLNAQRIQFYFTYLRSYNCQYFNYYMEPTSRKWVDFCEEKILTAIKDIREKDNLDFDVQAEYKKTIELFQRANKNYYEKLSLRAKAFLYYRDNFLDYQDSQIFR